MSQVKFHTKYKEKTVVVVAGWDKPLSHYFLNVIDVEPAEGEDETIWSSMFNEGEYKFTYPLRSILNGMGISCPDKFWELVEKNEGNVVHTFKNGEWRELWF